MKNTVSKELIESHWDSKFEIYELKQFKDERGMVCETFRLDDIITSQSKMCYISETEPFIMRGPHQHSNQDDNFISWKNHMVYEMYNPETKEFKHFITEKEKIYLVIVKPPIIHAYRNIETTSMKTMNFPTSLFMGENKSEEIDEIRHEELVPNNKSIVVIGAGGRLGKALINELYKNNGYYKTNIIPVYNKMLNEYDVQSTISLIKNKIKDTKVVLINCAAKTNVQTNEDMMWHNCDLAFHLNKICELLNWNYIVFSTDYIFQEAIGSCQLSTYTNSKKEMESALNNLNYDKTLILRVANLLSDDENDTHNIVHKLWNSVSKELPIHYDPDIKICPTDVKEIAKYMAPKLILFDEELLVNSFTKINIIPNKVYNIKEFLFEFFKYTNINSIKGPTIPWFDKYNSGKKITIFNSEYAILNIVNKLKGE